MIQDMTISQGLIAFTKSVEEFRPTVYKDSAGINTVGYGEAYVPADSVRTEAEASVNLVRLLRSSAWVVRTSINVELTQYQFDALCDFVYNVGRGAFYSSTLRAMINAGNMSGAADQFLEWTRAGQTHPPGLLKRRRGERLIFLGQAGGGYADAITIAKQ